MFMWVEMSGSLEDRAVQDEMNDQQLGCYSAQGVDNTELNTRQYGTCKG